MSVAVFSGIGHVESACPKLEQVRTCDVVLLLSPSWVLHPTRTREGRTALRACDAIQCETLESMEVFSHFWNKKVDITPVTGVRCVFLF